MTTLLLKKIIEKLGAIWSYLYSYKVSNYLSVVRIFFYSGWISKEFKAFGKNSTVYSFRFLFGGKYITIGDNCSFGKGMVLTAWYKHGAASYKPQIIIGNNVSIGDDSHISAINRIEIGNNVLTGKKVTIVDSSHGKSSFELMSIPPAERPLHSDGPILIEDGVWIGDKVTILSNVHIGKNAIIGANAVVTHDIPANGVAAGIPTKIIKIME